VSSVIEGEAKVTHVHTHNRPHSSVLGMQVNELFKRETGTDVGVDDEEFLEVG
jgi:hypothetical protein